MTIIKSNLFLTIMTVLMMIISTVITAFGIILMYIAKYETRGDALRRYAVPVTVLIMAAFMWYITVLLYMMS